MPLTIAEGLFLEDVLHQARHGGLKKPKRLGRRIVARMAEPGVVRLEIYGTTDISIANKWVTGCARLASRALRQASPKDDSSIVIHIPLNR